MEPSNWSILGRLLDMLPFMLVMLALGFMLGMQQEKRNRRKSEARRSKIKRSHDRAAER